MTQTIYTIYTVIQFASLAAFLIMKFTKKKWASIPEHIFATALFLDIILLVEPKTATTLTLPYKMTPNLIIAMDALCLLFLILYEISISKLFETSNNTATYCFNHCEKENVMVSIVKSIDDFKTDIEAMYMDTVRYDCAFVDNIINNIKHFDKTPTDKSHIPDDMFSKMDKYYNAHICHIEIKNDKVHIATKVF